MNSIYLSLQRFVALLLLIILIPAWIILFILVKRDSKGPFLFRQKRMGKNKRVFTIYKIRTMYQGAEELQEKYRHINEAQEPVFKILNDPRFTKVGKFLAHTGLDELPQLWNIVKGDMLFVGPRPLPVSEAEKIPSKYENRFSVLPGITSLWVINGSHKLSFNQWMQLDVLYIQKRSVLGDIQIMLKTFLLLLRSIGKGQRR